MKTREEIITFIKKQELAFIASIDEDGFPNMKAMLMPRKIEGDSFYFSTNTSSMRVSQYEKNEKACIYFYHKGKIRYEGVMFIGTMEVLTTPEIKKEIWNTRDIVYYPKGVTDSDYCVLKFTATKGRHYSGLKTENFAY
jgi:Uncharacterized stress protein (general stress protein 26)